MTYQTISAIVLAKQAYAARPDAAQSNPWEYLNVRERSNLIFDAAFIQKAITIIALSAPIIEHLRATLLAVREAILLSPAVSDTVWLAEECPETVIDCIEAALEVDGLEPFQARVNNWMRVCFFDAVTDNREERLYRFFEEAGELVQALGMSEAHAMEMVRYVWSRKRGEPHQEMGGVMVTLAALGNACQLDMTECSEVELGRIWSKIHEIRSKQETKPHRGPLPDTSP